MQGRLVVGMGHTSECGVVVASVGAPHGPCSVVAVRERRDSRRRDDDANGRALCKTDYLSFSTLGPSGSFYFN